MSDMFLGIDHIEAGASGFCAKVGAYVNKIHEKKQKSLLRYLVSREILEICIGNFIDIYICTDIKVHDRTKFNRLMVFLARNEISVGSNIWVNDPETPSIPQIPKERKRPTKGDANARKILEHMRWRLKDAGVGDYIIMPLSPKFLGR
jgi:hypothetical protein